MLSSVTKFLLIASFLYRCSAVKVNGINKPRFHPSPPYGWMNDPNGLTKFRNTYHLFYQYNPESSHEPGIAHWGHMKSSDLINWQDLPIAMYPDKSYDKSGVFSGSAIIEQDTMILLYTGHVINSEDTADYEEHQIIATSVDGINFKKYAGNPIITAEEHQPNIRDPKVWKHGENYYMVLGNSFNNNTLGRALLYSSKDLVSWQQKSILGESDGSLGFMWECPDFFELNGYFVLLFSPQGIKPQGDKYNNLYQTGYIVGKFDYITHVFTPITEFIELDHGHDFYATQTILDKGRRIVIAWLSMWEQVYPERDDGWAGQMTIPRVLSLSKDLRLIQKPIKEISAAQGRTLYSGKASGGHTVQLRDKTGEITIKAPKGQNLYLFLESTNVNVLISYDFLNGTVTLDRGGEDGVRRTNWRPLSSKLEWYILVDASSIELFCGEGEVTFSSRFFPKSDVTLRLGNNVRVDKLTVSAMKRTVKVPDEY